MQDLNDLFYFVQVVDHGGFAPAGRALNIPKSKLSRRIALLEERLGARLIQRSSRQFSVTEIGQEYYQRCVAMLVEAEAADQLIAEARDEPRGSLRISCPTGLLMFQFGPMIAQFMAAHPAVDVQLEGTNRRVDVIAEKFDIAIRVRFPPLEPTDLVMRRLDESTQCLVASPKLVAEALSSPADLRGLPSLDFAPQHRIHEWKLHHKDGQVATIPHRPRLATDDMSALRDAAIAGVGVVQLPSLMVWKEVAAGRLIHVLPDWRPPAGIVHAVFPTKRGLLPSVRALLDFMAEQCHQERERANASG